MSTPTKTLFVRLVAKPGQRDQLAAVLNEIIRECETEPGTREYKMSFEDDNADAIRFYESYDDWSAFEAHKVHRDTMTDLNRRMDQFRLSEELTHTTFMGGFGLPQEKRAVELQ